jgi:hypothetical protein
LAAWADSGLALDEAGWPLADAQGRNPARPEVWVAPGGPDGPPAWVAPGALQDLVRGLTNALTNSPRNSPTNGQIDDQKNGMQAATPHAPAPLEPAHAGGAPRAPERARAWWLDGGDGDVLWGGPWLAGRLAVKSRWLAPVFDRQHRSPGLVTPQPQPGPGAPLTPAA